jgi:DNA-binding transcriptional LysR family regulator
MIRLVASPPRLEESGSVQLDGAGMRQLLAWDDLRYILAVRRHGSLGRAAKALGLNKSTVGRRIAAIEEELGVALLQRGRNGYEFTGAGEAATTAAERIESVVNELVAAVGDTDRIAKGTVRVTVPAWFAQHLIIPALAAFRLEHPGLDVHLVTTDEVVDLGRRDADIGVRNVRPTQSSLIVRKGGVIAFGMYASREYVARHGMPRDRTDFASHHLIAYRDAVAYVDAYRWANALSDRVALRATDAGSMLDAVAAGLGIGVLPRFLADGAEGVVCVDTVGRPAAEVIWLVAHPDTLAMERVRTVMGWLVELFARNARSLAG